MQMPKGDKRLQALSGTVLVLFVIAALSQARVQVVERGSIISRASQTDRFIISRTEQAKRGIIFSADGKPLAEDEDSRVLNVDFRKVPHTPAFFMDVSAATGIPASEFIQLADSGLKTRTWRQPISSAQAQQLQEVKTAWRADGISLAPSGKRTYPLGEAAASFVGDVRDGVPEDGIERGYNKVLAGENGRKVGLVDRQGNFLPMRLDPKSVARVNGKDITLTIDSDLQTVASDAIRKAVEDNKAIQGVAIIIQPQTGDLLAMANWPSYDPNTLGQAEGSEQVHGYDPAYMADLEPGSMFKILTLAKAFDLGVVTDTDGVYCHGTLAVGNRSVSCDSHHGNRAHGLLSPTMAIAKSCNVSAATWALRIGYDNYVHYLEQLGIMSKPHLGLPGERSALFNYNDPAQELHLATLGFGQSINATPVALADAFAMLANNGMRMQPRLIKQIGDQIIPPKPLGQIVKPETTQRLLKIMQTVIESDAGTGKDLRIPGYILGGKTGTAQKVNSETHSMKGGGYVANFVGFVPGDKPQAVIVVMVDKPSAGKYYGASVAGPVFRQLAMAYIQRYNVPPNAPITRGPSISMDDLKTTITRIIAPPHVDVAQLKADIKAREDAANEAKELAQHAAGKDFFGIVKDDQQSKRIGRVKEQPPVDTTTPQLLPDPLESADPDQDQPTATRHRRHHRKERVARGTRNGDQALSSRRGMSRQDRAVLQKIQETDDDAID